MQHLGQLHDDGIGLPVIDCLLPSGVDGRPGEIEVTLQLFCKGPGMRGDGHHLAVLAGLQLLQQFPRIESRSQEHEPETHLGLPPVPWQVSP
jgi:hypothetical protein